MSKMVEIIGKVWISKHGFRNIEIRTHEWQEALMDFSDGDKVKIVITKNDEQAAI